jgi:hypothetical protein
MLDPPKKFKKGGDLAQLGCGRATVLCTVQEKRRYDVAKFIAEGLPEQLVRNGLIG